MGCAVAQAFVDKAYQITQRPPTDLNQLDLSDEPEVVVPLTHLYTKRGITMFAEIMYMPMHNEDRKPVSFRRVEDIGCGNVLAIRWIGVSERLLCCQELTD
jgi:hypothetical protein